MMMNVRQLFLAAATPLVLVGVLGCEATHRASPLVTEYDEQNVDAEMDFWHGLAEEPITTNNDAFHGLIEFDQGSDPNRTYEERVTWLTQQGYLDANFKGDADEAVKRGTVAQILARMLGVDGGLTMRLIGANPRYATRELIYLRVMRGGTAQQALSGIQFVGIMGKAHDFDGRVP